MKKLIGILLVIAGVALGVYCGIWWAFIGGIISVIEQIRAPELNAATTALAIVRIIFAGAIFWLSAVSLILPGMVIYRLR